MASVNRCGMLLIGYALAILKAPLQAHKHEVHSRVVGLWPICGQSV